eukprot:TRINITY_DN420_c3_g1_i2.p1 TRINITY_DN420_c3_g1~~TRINITY_DN420_c3_g1_i2.p1  ORF type:complete len:808 (+),score=342.91 TRINITY_DN420_c3_g1_i2:818-3241(+)
MAAISRQGKLTRELRAAINEADSVTALDDVYAPFKGTRITKADAARQAGYGPLAEAAWGVTSTDDPGASFETLLWQLSQSRTKQTEALDGAAMILAERISRWAPARKAARAHIERSAFITAAPLRYVSGAKKAASKKGGGGGGGAPAQEADFSHYHGFDCVVREVQGHQWLALRRGAAAKALNVNVKLHAAANDHVLEAILHSLPPAPRSRAANDCLAAAAQDAWKRLLAPSIQREVLKEGYRKGDTAGMEAFASNLRAALLAPPLRDTRILGVDPGLKHGVKLAALGPQSEVLELKTILPYANNAAARGQAVKAVAAMIETHGVQVVALGNGVGVAQAQQLIAEARAALGDRGSQVRCVTVSEAGASVWSVSAAAASEFPGVDCSSLGAVSIGRRLADPLSELVKVEPSALGVGMYQHDLPAKELNDRLFETVCDCVAEVGVELNSASEPLLAHVSGLTKAQARSIRSAALIQPGGLRCRQSLIRISGIGPKAFQQAAGFLRITGSLEPLDETRVHPESYGMARAILTAAGVRTTDIVQRSRDKAEWSATLHAVNVSAVAEAEGASEIAVRDIISLLLDPWPDPRGCFSALPALAQQTPTPLADLEVGGVFWGTVRNVVPFGAFIDCGFGTDGLLHSLAMPKPTGGQAAMQLGDVVQVRVLSVDKERKRVALALVDPPNSEAAAAAAAAAVAAAAPAAPASAAPTSAAPAAPPAAAATAPQQQLPQNAAQQHQEPKEQQAQAANGSAGGGDHAAAPAPQAAAVADAFDVMSGIFEEAAAADASSGASHVEVDTAGAPPAAKRLRQV